MKINRSFVIALQTVKLFNLYNSFKLQSFIFIITTYFERIVSQINQFKNQLFYHLIILLIF
jgi:hypothetical protein